MFDLADLASAVDHDCRNEARPYLRRAENRVSLTQKESRVKGSHTDRSPDLMKQSIRPHDVRITSVAAFVTGGQKYDPESGCCLQGNLTEECQVGHVYRLWRGSGTIKMLQRISGDANATLKHVVVARGGANYKVVDASTFIDAYFGLELMPLQSVCRTLTPEQEMVPLQLKASPNCVIQRHVTAPNYLGCFRVGHAMPTAMTWTSQQNRRHHRIK